MVSNALSKRIFAVKNAYNHRDTVLTGALPEHSTVWNETKPAEIGSHSPIGLFTGVDYRYG